MKKVAAILLCLVVGIGLFTACSSVESSDEAKNIFKIALITKNGGDSYWVALEEGAMRAASELDVEIVDLLQENETDEPQNEQIANAASAGCHAIVIAADDTEEVAAALQDAVDGGMKVVCVDSVADVEAAAFVTDQKAAGRAAGEAMLEVLEAKRITKGEVGIIGIDDTHDSAVQREAGFREAFNGKEYTLVETQYGEGDVSGYRTIAEGYVSQRLAGIFCCDESSAVQAGKVARETGARVAVIGFGGSDEIHALMKDGSIRATVIQNPNVMGYEGVKAAVALIKGENLSSGVTDTGVTVLKSEAPVVTNSDHKIALIAMDRIDQRGILLEEGAMKAAAELGCQVVNLSPKIKNDEQQIEQVGEAVSAGFHAIVIAANDPDAISSSLQEAMDAGLEVVCVDSPANVEAAKVCADDKTAGRTAAETMISALEEQDIEEGAIGIIGIDEDSVSAAAYEAGFREAFAEKTYELLETQYSAGDAAQSHAIAENYLDEDTVGIFCCNEGSTIGAGNAAEEEESDVIVVGFGDSSSVMDLLDDGYIHAVIIPNTETMGYESVQAACAALNGEELNGMVIDAGVSVLLREEE